MYLLSIETTCDETAAAVIEDVPGRPVPRVVSSVVASQFNLHERFGGVVPEVAAREHVRQILPVIDEALRKADIGAHELGAVAVAVRPGLVGALIVGLTAAKAIALGLEIPLVAFDHLEGHLYAAQLAYPEDSVYPAVGLVVSGGHTSLYGCQGPVESTLLGGTIDDAAGEAFDKVASLLGLGFPGGPAVEKIARDGNPKAFDLPRTFIHDARLDFSFSGLKTAALYALHGQDARNAPEALDPKVVADLAASFQRAVCEVLTTKTAQALDATQFTKLLVGGGVAANTSLRTKLQHMCIERDVKLFIPPIDLCTDNAAMGAVAVEKLRLGQVSDLEIDVAPGLVRPRKAQKG